MECFVRRGPENAGIMGNPAYADCFIYTACGNFIATSKLSLATRSSYFHQIFIQEQNKGNVNVFMFEFSHEIVQLALDVTFGSEVNVTVKQSGRLKFLLNKLKIKFEAITTTAAVQQVERPYSILGQEEERAKLQEEQRVKNKEEQAKVEEEEQAKVEEEERAKVEEERAKNKQEQQEILEEEERARIEQELAKNEQEQQAEVEQEKQPHSDHSKSSLLNWTETTSDINVENICHTRITGQKGEKYMCIKCKATSNYFRLAQKHWNREHKDFTKFRTLLIDTEFERKILEARCAEISKYIVLKKPTNDANLSMELRRMHEKVYEIMEKFDQVKRLDLDGAPTLIRKKHSMLKVLDDIGGKIDSAIDMLEIQ